MLSQGGGGGEGHYGYMQEDGFSTLSLSFPCRWQPFGLGIVNLKTHSLRNQTGRTGGGGGVGKRERVPMCLLFQTK